MEESAEPGSQPQRYFVDVESANQGRRSLSGLIAARKCYECQQADTPESVLDSEPDEHLKRVTDHCAHTSDYILPDTPLKETIFRTVLAGGNQPATAQEITDLLAERWGVASNPRDFSPTVIERLLSHSEAYCLVALPPEASEGGGKASKAKSSSRAKATSKAKAAPKAKAPSKAKASPKAKG